MAFIDAQVVVECDDCGETEWRDVSVFANQVAFRALNQELEKEEWTVVEDGRKHYCPSCTADRERDIRAQEDDD